MDVENIDFDVENIDFASIVYLRTNWGNGLIAKDNGVSGFEGGANRKS
jgi:hypothetical protein